MTRDYGLKELRAAVANIGVSAPRFSQWSVGMHVHHCCLSMIGVCTALGASTPPPPRSRPSLASGIVLLTGRIPRGRAKSPQGVLPKAEVTESELLAHLDESERMVAEARRLPPDAWFRHFFLGVLDRDKAMRFVSIHNRHHLRIIADIVAG
jgi:hypothetical protein